MGRQRKPFIRPEDKRSAKLIIIATEGRKTEKIYFEELANQYDKKNIHIEIIPKFDDNSNPESVFIQLEEFEKKYIISEDDELWMVIDRDFQSWEIREIKYVAQLCMQKNNYNFGLSNPAFEIWLLCHLTDISKLNSLKKKELFHNRKKGKRTACEIELLKHIRSYNKYNKSNYDPSIFTKNIIKAIENAEKIDINKKSRWPSYLGTRLYILAKSIIGQ